MASRRARGLGEAMMDLSITLHLRHSISSGRCTVAIHNSPGDLLQWRNKEREETGWVVVGIQDKALEHQANAVSWPANDLAR